MSVCSFAGDRGDRLEERQRIFDGHIENFVDIGLPL
jgi:hypothetical protein